MEFYTHLNGLGMSVIVGKKQNDWSRFLENSCEGFAFFSVCKMVTEPHADRAVVASVPVWYLVGLVRG